jgi:hypothetical protein
MMKLQKTICKYEHFSSHERKEQLKCVFFTIYLSGRKEKRPSGDLLLHKRHVAQAPRVHDIINVINIVTFSYFNYVSIEARVAS